MLFISEYQPFRGEEGGRFGYLEQIVYIRYLGILCRENGIRLGKGMTILDVGEAYAKWMKRHPDKAFSDFVKAFNSRPSVAFPGLPA